MKKIKLTLYTILLLIIVLFGVWFFDTENPLEKNRTSHINTKAPDRFETFNKILTRDLTNFFVNYTGRHITIKYDLLRNKPTQAGVADPKFYIWVKIFNSGNLIDSGAVKVAMVTRTRAEVTNFIPKKQIIPQSHYRKG